MAPSIWQILIVVLIVVIFFGRGKLSHVMEDLAKGITSFKKGLKEGDEANPVLENKKSESEKE